MKKSFRTTTFLCFCGCSLSIGGAQASTVAGFQGTAEDAQKLLETLYAKGVLSKPNEDLDLYELAPSYSSRSSCVNRP